MRKIYNYTKNFFENLFAHDNYGDMGYFLLNHKHTVEYEYANWGSRKWEYYYVEKLLEQINIKNKNIIDIGIGLPGQYDFYRYYINKQCRLTAVDPDSRLKSVTILSTRCKILRQSATNLSFAKSNSVDVVVCISTVEHIPYDDFMSIIREVHRVLKKTGHFILTIDLTYEKKSSAPWAILEKTYNGLSKKESRNGLEKNHKQITLNNFYQLLSKYFYVKNAEIKEPKDIKQLLYSKKHNDYIGYMHLYKK